MKEKVVQKINQFGKIGQILANISMAICGVAILLCFIFAIGFLTLPKNFIQVAFNDRMTIQTDFSSISQTISEDEMQNLKESIVDSNSGVTLNNNSYTVDNVIFEDSSATITGSSGEHGFTLHDISFALFIGILILVFVWICFFLISSLCKEMKFSETPFSEKMIKKLNYVAISLIPMSLMLSIGSSVITSILAGGVSLSLNLNWSSLVLIILIFGLVQVFKYGAMLQRESDETL